MAKELNVKLREAYDTEANWGKSNPVLLAGQLAFSSDKYGKYKVGDGIKTWNQLEYVKTKWEDIEGKPSTFNPPAHTHTISQISDIGNASVKHANTAGSANAVAWANVSGKPSTFNPTTHNHDDRYYTETEMNTKLEGKANTNHEHYINHIRKSVYNYAGSVSAINRSLFNASRACRTAFFPANAITVEYTIDNGSSWHDYDLSNQIKAELFSMSPTSSTIRLGGANAQMKLGNGVRVTIKAIDRYVSVDTFYCWFSTGGSQCVVNIEKATKAAPTSFQSVVSNIRVDGWSGANEIGFNSIPFGGGSNQFSNIDSLRFTFLMTKVGSVATNCATVTDLRLYGDSCWISNNPMMSNDHMYTWDYNKNVSFPADIKGKSFHGDVFGNATTATKLGTTNVGSVTQPMFLNAGVPTACTYTLAKSVPSNAVFTDTVYTHPSSHSGTMISQDSTHRFTTDSEKNNWNNKTKVTIVRWS